MRNLSITLKTPVLAALMAATMLTALPARAEVAQTAPAPATITVTGSGSVESAPDMATVSLGVTTIAATAAEALTQNSTAMEAVIARLKAAGVTDADMRTDGLSVNPNWSSYSSSTAQSIDGFTAGNILLVQIRDLSSLGAVLDAAVADGANTLNGLTFGLKDAKPNTNEARKAAVADARATAELLAEAAGAKLGPLVSVADGGGYGGPAPMFKADAASAVPIQQGQVSTQASVTVIWQLVD